MSPGSAVELDDIQPPIVVSAVDQSGGVDEHVGGLDYPCTVRPDVHHARGYRRRQRADFFGMKLVADVERASFGLPKAQHALIPFAGALVQLSQQISYCQAMQIMLTGERLSAQEAYRIGLINEVVPSEDVLPRARAIADRIARNGPLAVRKIKKTVMESIGCRLDEAYRMEDVARQEILPTEDAIEGPKAFFAKREPVFTGR